VTEQGDMTAQSIDNALYSEKKKTNKQTQSISILKMALTDLMMKHS
jgi:hypothetical protein